ncbi:MAG: hypothetical protein K0R28_35 [Paenibacillus sp.]|nr:hypothetical protein [Paenibacillus sp.]
MSRNRSDKKTKMNGKKQIQLDVIEIMRYLGKDPRMASKILSDDDQPDQPSPNSSIRILGKDSIPKSRSDL